VSEDAGKEVIGTSLARVVRGMGARGRLGRRANAKRSPGPSRWARTARKSRPAFWARMMIRAFSNRVRTDAPTTQAAGAVCSQAVRRGLRFSMACKTRFAFAGPRRGRRGQGPGDPGAPSAIPCAGQGTASASVDADSAARVPSLRRDPARVDVKPPGENGRWAVRRS